MTERRFTEAEVAAIFERATQSPQPGHTPVKSGEGMTLAQLEEIGREVGIAPDAIRDAANVVSHSGLTTSRRVLGLPIGVGRTIELGRKLTDEEWERLVVDLRETFDARGVVRSEGSLRHWSNGNLQALLEPTATGHRVRLRTFKQQAMNFMVAGVITVGISAVTTFAFAPRMVPVGAPLGGVVGTGLLAIAGAALIALGAALLPGWARLRRRQMEDVAARLVAATSAPPRTR